MFLSCGLCTRCNWNRTNFTPCNCSHSGVGLVVQNKTPQERCVWRNPKLHSNVRQAVRQEQQTDQFASRVAASRFIGALTYLRNIPISLHLQRAEAQRCLLDKNEAKYFVQKCHHVIQRSRTNSGVHFPPEKNGLLSIVPHHLVSKHHIA